MKRLIAAAGICLMLGACAFNQASTSTNERWAKVWNDREATYTQDAKALGSTVNKGYDDYLRFATYSPNDSAESGRKLSRLAKLWFQYSKVNGQQAALAQFKTLRLSKPTVGIVSTWFQDQVQKLLDLDRQTQSRYKAFLTASADTSKPYPNWFQDARTVIRERGLVLGASDELLRLHRETKAYYKDMQGAAARDYDQRMRGAAALMAIGNALQRQSYQQQIIHQMNRPRTCRKLGNSVTCY